MGPCGWLAFCLVGAMLLVLCVIWAAAVAAEEPAASGTRRCYGRESPTSAEDSLPGTVAADATAIEASAQRTAGTDPVDVDSMSVGPPLPAAGVFPDDPDALVEAIFAKNEAMGEELQDTAAESRGSNSSAGTLAEAAQRVEDSVVSAASPAPPQFEPLALDVLPQKYWEPVYSGYAPVFTEKRCDFFQPTPRLWVTDLNQLQYARSLEQGRVNMIEPLKARQALAQLLSVGVRTRRDLYTQASPANDIASQSKCAQLKIQTPAYVRL